MTREFELIHAEKENFMDVDERTSPFLTRPEDGLFPPQTTSVKNKMDNKKTLVFLFLRSSNLRLLSK